MLGVQNQNMKMVFDISGFGAAMNTNDENYVMIFFQLSHIVI